MIGGRERQSREEGRGRLLNVVGEIEIYFTCRADKGLIDMEYGERYEYKEDLEQNCAANMSIVSTNPETSLAHAAAWFWGERRGHRRVKEVDGMEISVRDERRSMVSVRELFMAIGIIP